jgi:hypothetical protein
LAFVVHGIYFLIFFVENLEHSFENLSFFSLCFSRSQVSAHYRLVDPYFTLRRISPDTPLAPDSEVLVKGPSGLSRGCTENPESVDIAMGWDLWTQEKRLRLGGKGRLGRSESWYQFMRRRDSFCSDVTSVEELKQMLENYNEMQPETANEKWVSSNHSSNCPMMMMIN